MRVLVCRVAAQGEATGRRLAARGHQPILAPLSSVEPLPCAGPPDGLDAVIVTSQNAVPGVAAWRDCLESLPIFAVGTRSAAALRAAGLARVVAGDGGGEALARLVADRLPAGARLLHPAGTERRPEPERSLRAAGFAVEVRPVYRLRRATRLPAAAASALAARAVDAVLHYSPRSAGLLIDLAREAGLLARLGEARHLCLSGAVAAACRDLPPDRVVVAAAPCEDALLAALDRSRPPEDDA